jgi:ribose-phosphate pyrophosphokinase
MIYLILNKNSPSVDEMVKYDFDQLIKHETFKFSGGEQHIKILINNEAIDPLSGETVIIIADTSSSDGIMQILLAHDAIKRLGARKIRLLISYIPYARQDKVMVTGEPLSIKVFTELINNCKFDEVLLFDPHSDVAPALLNNCNITSNHKFILDCARVIHDKGYDRPLLVSPDSGAYKKIFKLAEATEYKGEIVLCNKARDLNNGKILSYTVDKDDLKRQDCLIVDDICDGGGTFLLMAEELRKKNCGKIYLAVTHGIFSKGTDIITDKFDLVFTTDSFKTLESSDKFFVFPFIKYFGA